MALSFFFLMKCVKMLEGTIKDLGASLCSGTMVQDLIFGLSSWSFRHSIVSRINADNYGGQRHGFLSLPSSSVGTPKLLRLSVDRCASISTQIAMASAGTIATIDRDVTSVWQTCIDVSGGRQL